MSGPMNNPMNDHELTNALKQRADDFARLGGHDMDLAQVVSRAGEIRRGRRMRASIVMAAVALAIAVPVGVVAIGDDNASNPEPGPLVTSTPTPTESPTPDPTPTKLDDSPLVLGDLPQGEAPALAYTVDGEIRGGPAGPITTFQGQRLWGLAQLNGGFLVTHQDKDYNMVVSFVDDQGTEGQTWPIDNYGLIVSPEGNVGVFGQPDGTIVAVQDGGSRWYELSKIPGNDAGVDPISISGENCSDRSATPGCTVIVKTYISTTQAWQTQNGPVATRLPEPYSKYVGLSSVSRQGDSAGYVSIDEIQPGSCSAVFDPTGTRLFKTCDYSFDEFSPDGTHILATTPYRDGEYLPNVAVLDLDGKVVLDLHGKVMYTRWEDNDHVLVSIGDGTGKSAVIRIGLDGHREYALAPRASELRDAHDGEYVLATDH